MASSEIFCVLEWKKWAKLFSFGSKFGWAAKRQFQNIRRLPDGGSTLEKNHQIWPGLSVVKLTLSCWRNTGADLRGNAQQNGTTGWKPWCSGYRLSVMIIDPEFKSRMLKWIFVAIICCQCKLSLQRPKKCKRSQVWWTLKNNILWIIFCCDLFVRRRLKVPFNGTYNLLRFVQ